MTHKPTNLVFAAAGKNYRRIEDETNLRTQLDAGRTREYEHAAG
jgi:hypothetical protein